MKSPLTLPAPAKLNLFLHIVGRRADGYHMLNTLFQFLDHGDSLTFTPTATATVSVHCSQPTLEGPDNLVNRAVQLVQEKFPNHWHGLRIDIEKRLPVGGGLGGGSSDAATTLLALRHLWQLPMSDDELAQLGVQLGADVPVFVHGNAAFAVGIGEQLTACQPASPWYLVIHPDIHISTREIFQHPDLPRASTPIQSHQWTWENTHNDCEQLVRQLHPEVANALDWLVEYAPSRLTGTGACIFGRFDSQTAATDTLAQLPAPWTGFVARGLNESPVCSLLRQASTVNLTKQY
ncbi:MAG TPA: 4-(cytidine 5'-diphospho)-2-C-methyl-D-erythritol kinase [Pseudidiomarina sp.]|nr:4-(cytidine 5'-diphospho)-2-C-methyl-D-erythritol kinase [Pseudidiomarina sp.]